MREATSLMFVMAEPSNPPIATASYIFSAISNSSLVAITKYASASESEAMAHCSPLSFSFIFE